MIPVSTSPIRPNAEFLVSSARPHLFENPFFPATGSEVPLCRTDDGLERPTHSELMEPGQAVDVDTLWVGRDHKYLDTVVDCQACRDDYRSRFQQ